MTKPYLIWYYDGEYPAVPDARLHINIETNIVESVEYPDEPSNWADEFIGKTISEIDSIIIKKGHSYVFMKDCW